MANESLAVSSRHRNSILGIAPTNIPYLRNKYPVNDTFAPYFCNELGTLVGLAFTATLTESTNMTQIRKHISCYLDHQHSVNEPNDVVFTAIQQILEYGLTAFRSLGYPHYFDDFIWAYHRILNSNNIVHPILQEEMRRILKKFI